VVQSTDRDLETITNDDEEIGRKCKEPARFRQSGCARFDDLRPSSQTLTKATCSLKHHKIVDDETDTTDTSMDADTKALFA
jgi:hypothetical protein